MQGPFATIESAHEYVTLLGEQVRDVKASIAGEITAAVSEGGGRRLDALRIVDLKLNQLANNLSTTSRILNDLRVLRRLLNEERGYASTPVPETAPAPVFELDPA
jgi:hypothetical protein